MQALIAPVDKSTLESELTRDKWVRKANFGDNQIYIITAHDSPNIMKEIGRLRELSFRTAGGGTGNEIDIDSYDNCALPYKQLIVWNPEDKEIVGGYRFIRCNELIDEKGHIDLATTELFRFTPKFVKEFLPYTIELGRSFVQPGYQPSVNNRKGLFSLDNLWDGLGALVKDNPDIRYFFGKITMYTHYNPEARDLILYFMSHYFPDPDKLVYPINPLEYKTDISQHIGKFDGLSYKEGHRVLNQFVRKCDENIPPLVNSYMNLSASMRSFGTCINHHFGGVEETGILVVIDDIYESKRDRHIGSYS